ncbi:MAG: nucleotidyltransferase family protein [Gemmatimonadaceae bacterium]
MRSEAELVIALSRTPIGSEAQNRVSRLLESGIDWDVVVRLVSEWRVEATVFGNLGSQFAGAVPPDVRIVVAALEKQSRAYTVSRTLILTNLVNELNRLGVPALVLKGPATAVAAYGDCSRRIFYDADLLVHRADLARGRDILLDSGYSASFHAGLEDALISGQHALEFSDSRMAVELHWTLLSRHLRFNVNVDDLWNESVVIECLDSRLRTLAPEHHFLYLCAHAAKHEWRLLRWICDVAQLCRRLSARQAESVVALAEKTHARRILSLGLRIVREFYGEEDSPFPPSAFRTEGETAPLVAVVKARLMSGAGQSPNLLPSSIGAMHEYMEPLTFWLRSRERLIDRVGSAAQFIFVPAASDTGRGQMQGMLRPVRLAAKALRHFAHAS